MWKIFVKAGKPGWAAIGPFYNIIVLLEVVGRPVWWIVMLLIQGRYGADVLAYSESLASVSFTSTSTEVVRGLGYWLFYIRDGFGATTAASLDYLVSGGIIAVGALLLACCLVGLVATRWAHRRYAAMLVGAGTILAVGVHPIDDPSPAMSVLVGNGEGGLALALRSSSRAVPVMVLGLALGAAMFVSAARTWSFRRSGTVGSSTRGSSATRTRPTPGSTPRRRSTHSRAATGCCRFRAPSSARTAGATPSTSHSPLSPSVRS